MKRPSEYPNVPVNNYIDNVGPSVKAEFLNPTQEGLSDLIGMMFGRSATCVIDDFTELTYGPVARGKFSTVLSLNASSDWRAPTAANQHGVLGVTATAAGPVNHILADAQYGIGQVDFTVSMRACLDDRASLDTVANLGWYGGLRDGVIPSDAIFVAGNDSPNWHVRIGAVLTDCAVAIVDGRFYDLQIARINQTAYAYIDGALVLTQAYPDNLVNANRQLQLSSPAMPINKGYAVDYHRLGIRR